MAAEGSVKPLKVLGKDFDPDEAFFVVLGYAFGTRPFKWRRPRGAVGERPSATEARRWGYETYDCVDRHPGTALAGVDLLVAAGLNARIDASVVASLLAVEPEVSAALKALARAGGDVRFWDLERDDLTGQPPDQGSPARPLWRAWSVLMGAGDVGVAVTHKTLHHKRPDMFPLIDNRTLAAFKKEPWAEIHDDLRASREEWATLEDRFCAAAATLREASQDDDRPGLRLTRLRLHDILLWTCVSGDWDAAGAAGRAIADTL